MSLHRAVDGLSGHVDMKHAQSHYTLLFAMFAVPLTTAGTIALLIPLAIYVMDYAAFQNLNVIRPDHYCRLLIKVYRVWLGANGKMSSKDL
mmetsp:Transcript_28707/g.69947  ORF Transcript_28707/g.69947 Transcript_28707/m.69947 type:complete len:91 (+) Transcript_28707:1-273(+)